MEGILWTVMSSVMVVSLNGLNRSLLSSIPDYWGGESGGLLLIIFFTLVSIIVLKDSVDLLFPPNTPRPVVLCPNSFLKS